MTTKILQATTATLLRYNIGFDQLPRELKSWTLPFPYWQTCKQISIRLAAHLEKEDIGVPYRQLNNVLMTQFGLTHGFDEWDGTTKSLLAMFITDTNEDVLPPTIDAIQYTIEAWLEWWIKLHTDDDSQIQMQLLAYYRENLIQPDDWHWQAYTLQDLLNLFEEGKGLPYTAIPNLVAHLLHGKESVLNGHTVRWRKVQDGESKKLSIVGFANKRPFYAQYNISGRTGIKEGEGYFAYKINFTLETQSGRAEPWLFVTFHAQRYGDTPLQKHNKGRRVSLLHAPNTSPLVRKKQLAPLINIHIKSKDDSFAWDNYPPDLLQTVSTIQLVNPNDIVQDPQRYWFTDDEHDEYYLVHAEGYKYDESGNKLEAGLSQGDMFRVSQAIEAHLPMLGLDQPLTPDPVQTPHGKNRPLLLQSHTNWSNKPILKQKFEGTQAEREAERTARYLQQREEYQDILDKALQRATDGPDVHIAIFWHNTETHNGLNLALRETFLLNPGNDFPDTVTVNDHHVNGALLEELNLDAYKGQKDRYLLAQQDRVRLWRIYLQDLGLPDDKPIIAFVELLCDNQDKGLFGVKGAVREACARENITSQMIFPVRMGQNDEGQLRYLAGRYSDGEHRAKSASRDLILRHTGPLYDTPVELFSHAGFESPFEILSFYLHKTNNNILFPIATKFTASGRHFVRWPGCDGWIPYHLAAPKLGQLFASEWKNRGYKGIPKMSKSSCLNQNKRSLILFAQELLSDLSTPTLCLVEADNWRNSYGWEQLRNPDLTQQLDMLSFKPNGHLYLRDNPEVENLIAVIRFKSGVQTPQYITDSQRDFSHEYGLYEMSDELLHYYSVGRSSITSQQQRSPRARELAPKTGSIASGIAYKHALVVELTPFFVHPDYKSLDGQLQLCRIPHMLRHAPAYAQSNIVLPYPMHLAKQLIQDQLCILAMDD